MANRARDVFFQLLDEEEANIKEKYDESEVFFESLLKDDVQIFSNAVKKFCEKGELDNSTLHITKEIAALNQEKKGGRRKKNEVLKETNIESIDSVKIKKEKISDASAKENIEIKNNEMAAPSWIPPKKKIKEIKTERISTVRTTRTKGRNVSKRESDVILQNPVIPTVDLSENEDTDNMPQTRSTRTKTRNKKTEAVNEAVEIETRSTRTKTLRKCKQEEIPAEPEMETRSTRTKTIRKAKENDNEAKTGEMNESQMSTRSTRTKTIKKCNDTVDTNETNESEPTRSTRTKTIRKHNTTETNMNEASHEITKQPDDNSTKPEIKPKSKRNRSDEDEDIPKDTGKKKSKSNSPANTTTHTEYEDARSSFENNTVNKQINSTYIAPLKPELPPVPPLELKNANETIVVAEPRFNIFDKKPESYDMFTDDESLELQRSPKKAPLKSTKEVFSPYEKTTIKKKVEAFEKLQKVNEVPSKSTGIPRSARDTPVKERAKLYNTPLSKFMPCSSSTSKVSRILTSHVPGSRNNDSLSSTRCASAQKDPRERQRKILEREQASKKKDAMLMAQAEAKRKLNEEKQLKAQQQRKILEAEKLKQLEIQKQKEERQKQRERERDEYLQKQKQEVEKKRLAHKEKLKELQAQRAETQKPIYMTTKAPLLPTEDCYDSDESHDTKSTNRKACIPDWCNDKNTKPQLLAMMAAGHKIKNTLFCSHAQTPDLTEIFESIDASKLQRTSSRLWKRSPRYTMMQDLNETFSDEGEDDDVYQ